MQDSKRLARVLRDCVEEMELDAQEADGTSLAPASVLGSRMQDDEDDDYSMLDDPALF